jgi:hypothetical protein
MACLCRLGMRVVIWAQSLCNRGPTRIFNSWICSCLESEGRYRFWSLALEASSAFARPPEALCANAMYAPIDSSIDRRPVEARSASVPASPNFKG